MTARWLSAPLAALIQVMAMARLDSSGTTDPGDGDGSRLHGGTTDPGDGDGSTGTTDPGDGDGSTGTTDPGDGGDGSTGTTDPDDGSNPDRMAVPSRAMVTARQVPPVPTMARYHRMTTGDHWRP
ncbi:hypothetical protein [Cobetia sp. ICG0124]|uniref:hypothetical protein n=1 Tax=Cobetia sp. ICG0124 TaxID=2053669 RepID=UPI000FD7AEF2|nr:hypothetical protein [Cobetia sp. ICG0124]AZV31019.1 hypothetical protein CU110_06040 [Cobetia sp. ICG0124]